MKRPWVEFEVCDFDALRDGLLRCAICAVCAEGSGPNQAGEGRGETKASGSEEEACSHSETHQVRRVHAGLARRAVSLSHSAQRTRCFGSRTGRSEQGSEDEHEAHRAATHQDPRESGGFGMLTELLSCPTVFTGGRLVQMIEVDSYRKQLDNLEVEARANADNIQAEEKKLGTDIRPCPVLGRRVVMFYYRDASRAADRGAAVR